LKHCEMVKDVAYFLFNQYNFKLLFINRANH
jgi:hypothetical protein